MTRQSARERQRKKRVRQRANTDRDVCRKTARQTIMQIHKTQNTQTNKE